MKPYDKCFLRIIIIAIGIGINFGFWQKSFFAGWVAFLVIAFYLGEKYRGSL